MKIMSLTLLAVRKSHPTALGQAWRKTHHRSSPVLQMWSLPLWLQWWSLSDVWHYSFWLLCTPHCWTLHVKVGEDTGGLCKDEEPVCGQSSGPSHSETGQPGCREDLSTLFVLNWPKLSFWLFYITVSESYTDIITQATFKTCTFQKCEHYTVMKHSQVIMNHHNMQCAGWG